MAMSKVIQKRKPLLLISEPHLIYGSHCNASFRKINGYSVRNSLTSGEAPCTSLKKNTTPVPVFQFFWLIFRVSV